ncbi:putative dienelactone hydrolase [Thermocatellispora tengchongensis]|uniref:Putative dienelactone hydrolase n=2 Tax=Thermocatellispora tengchongensis TaxID=1073253 RepID=A0A840P8S1_9ACTN|nr:hypothetical protein [Thermocatellispora tengchongensis]MBB5135016.1 putative dienelactone hydrolase [Thermocatellispora tengchongensis]
MPVTILGLSPAEFAVVPAAVALVAVRLFPPRARRPVASAAAAVFAVSAVVAAVLGVRWQLAPVLAGGAVALALAVPTLLGRRAWPAGRWPAVAGSAACLALILAGGAVAWALPVPVFPEPSGPYAVGTTVVQWTDAGRAETATAARDDRRTVVVQLWYPARESPDAPRAHYLGRTPGEARAVARGAAAYLGVPGFVLDHLPMVRTHAVPGAPVAEGGGRFPVVLFSPGLGGVRTQNTAWAEELASRGYVVAGLDHPYDSAVVTLADGREIRTRVAATGDPERDERLAAGWTAVRAADLGFVLTQLARLDRGEIPGPLTGRLDTGRAAVTGHSIGGAAALQALRQDDRFAAAIDIDGFPRDPAPRAFHRPVLALTQDVRRGENPDYIPRLTEVLRLGTATDYLLTVPGSAHLTFTDAPLYLPPLPALAGSSGRTDGLRVTAAATVAFLDTVLHGRRDDLTAALSQYGELTVH